MFKVARLDFLGGDTPHVWALTKSAWVKTWEKVTTTVLYIDENLLWSGFYYNWSCRGNVTWRHYDFNLSLCFPVTGVFFLRNRLREYASIMAKFEQILWEHFGNIWKRSFKNHKNSEIACCEILSDPPWMNFICQLH